MGVAPPQDPAPSRRAADEEEDLPETTSVTRPNSRRAFFSGALAAAALLPRATYAQGKSRRRDSIRRTDVRFDLVVPREAVGAPVDWASPEARLVRRSTLGITGDDLAQARSLGYQEYLQQQLHWQEIDDTQTENFVAQTWPLLSQTPEQLYSLAQGTITAQLQEATLYRAAFSERQLYERMVEFWSDHFNISIDKVGWPKLIDDRDVIRRHALGRFSDLLQASAHSPAMLIYLDQTSSRNGRPNQNYAREVMELHTLGVDGGYTQNDVAELSRVLTGWTIQGRGDFYFDPTGHDWGQKTVLGITIPAGSPALGAAGVNEGEALLDMLAHHPSTARFIATKMLRWLLGADPTAEQITTISAVFRSTHGDISLMVRAILNDAWMTAAPAKFKRPFHFLVSALRSTNATVTSMAAMNQQLTNIGQPLFRWETPDGFPDKIEYWSGNILPRWGFANVLASANSAALAVATAPYLTGTPDAAIDLINAEFFGGEMALATRTALLTYLRGGTFNDARVRETIALALSASGFQWY